MKSYRYNNRVDDQSCGIWDVFVDHLNSIYFFGAAELLDNQTVAWEYHHFINEISMGQR